MANNSKISNKFEDQGNGIRDLTVRKIIVMSKNICNFLELDHLFIDFFIKFVVQPNFQVFCLIFSGIYKIKFVCTYLKKF